MEEVIDQQAAGADVIRDTILSRRLALTRVDAMRQYDTAAAVSAAARAALTHCPQEELLEQLSLIDRELPHRLQKLLGGSNQVALPHSNGHPPTALPEPMTSAMT